MTLQPSIKNGKYNDQIDHKIIGKDQESVIKIYLGVDVNTDYFIVVTKIHLRLSNMNQKRNKGGTDVLLTLFLIPSIQLLLLHSE